MSTLEPLLRILADGKFHSGEELGASLGITRSAVWKSLRALDCYQLGLASIRGRGYRLERSIEFLDEQLIRSRLTPAISERVPALDIFFEIDSTNRYLLSRTVGSCSTTSFAVCLSERQSEGRGRWGRTWVSPFGANIYFSLLWRYAEGTARLSGLSLAVAVACVRALTKLGAAGARIKWPNDIWWDEKKLAGILIEVSGESNGPCNVVIGIGINSGMPANTVIDQPWADMAQIVPGLSRNHLVSELIESLVSALDEFALKGFDAFASEWRQWDAIVGREVVVHLPNRTIRGVARGVQGDGTLLLDTEQGLQRFASGEVTLRTVDQ